MPITHLVYVRTVFKANEGEKPAARCMLAYATGPAVIYKDSARGTG